MLLLVLLIFNPISLDILFRGILPIIWTIIHLNESKYIYVSILNIIFLLILIVLDILLLRYIFLSKRKLLEIRLRKSDKFIVLLIVNSLIIYLLLFKTELIGILNEGGSNAIVIINEQKKTTTWFIYGLIGAFKAILIISLFFIESFWLKSVCAFDLLLLSTFAGKKSGLISLFSGIIFIYSIYKSIPKLKILDVNRLKIYKTSLKIFLIFVTSILFSLLYLIIQYERTENINTNVNIFASILTSIDKVFLLVYISSTLYLEQLFRDGGIELAEQYSAMLGDFGFIKYFSNPFTKFFFNSGIDFAIGPFLTNTLYGYNVPLGVNPTLLFEMIFIFGSITIGFLLSVFILIFTFFLQKKLINVMITSGNLYFSSSAYLIFSIIIFFRYDTLNAIRLIPFATIPLILYYLLKILPTKGRLM